MTDSTLQVAPQQQPTVLEAAQARVAANIPVDQLNQILHAYQTGAMAPADASKFEQSVHSGLIALPDNFHLAGKPPANPEKPQVEIPQAAVDAYNIAAKNPYDKGAMDYNTRLNFDKLLANGTAKLPSGSVLNQTYLGVTGNAAEALTGNLRSTPATKNNPDYSTMPELNSLSMPSAKSGLGTMLSTNPKEIAQIIQTQFPKVGVSQDERGNYLFKSGEDGKTYALKPGASLDDVIKGVGLLASFTPAGRAESVLGGAAASGATQLTMDASKAAVGGDAVDPKNALIAGGIGAAIPVVGKVIGAGKAMLQGDAKAGTEAASAATAPVADATGNVARETPPPVGTDPMAPRPANPTVDGVTDRIVNVESKGVADAKNPNSSASGAGQFLNSTWLDTVKKYAPDIAAGKTDTQIIALKSDADLSRQMVKAYADENAGILSAEGHAPTAGNLYLAHFAGPQGAIDLLNADAGASAKSILGSKVIAANPFLKDMSASDVVEWAANRMKGADSAAPEAATAAKNAAGATATDSAVNGAGNTATPYLSTIDLAKTAREAAMGGPNSDAAKAILVDQAAPNAGRVAAAKNLGMEGDLQPEHLSDNPNYRSFTGILKSSPGSATSINEAAGLERAATKANDLIEKLGGTKDISSMSENVKAGMQDTQKTLQAQGDGLYAKVRAAIPATAPAEASNVLSFIDQRAKDLGGVENLSPTERMIYRKLNPQPVDAAQSAAPIAEGQTITAAEYRAMQAAKASGATDVKQPTYALLDSIRQDVGNSLKNAGPYKDAATGLKKSLYQALTADQERVAAAHGVGDTYQLAKQTVAQRKAIEDHLTALFGESAMGTINNAVKGGIENLGKGDTAKFANFISHVPEDMRQNVVTSGLIAAFEKGSRSGKINFKGFSDWYEGLLKNKQAYNAIMANLPKDARNSLADLYQVSKGISLAAKEFVQTGRLNSAEALKVINEGFQKTDNLMSRMYEVAGHLGKHAGKAIVADMVGGHGLGMATAVISAFKSSGKEDMVKAVDAMIASPEFEAAAKKIVTGEPQKGAAILAYSKPFLKFARAMGNPREMTNKERWILSALQADNNQTKH